MKKTNTCFDFLSGKKLFFVFAVLLATTSIINAQITFTDIDAGLVGVFNCAISWGDYDNDGDLDLAIAGHISTYNQISKIYRNDNGNFIDINAGLVGVFNCAISWGDYDNDGDLDLVIAGYTGSNRISKIYRNDNGNFVDINAGLTGVYFCSLSWGDYDNDGDLDLAIAGHISTYNQISKIYRNDNGIFVNINAGLTGVQYGALSWGDYDNDGDLDLVISGIDYDYNQGQPTEYKITKIYNNNDGNFEDINAGLTGVYFCSLSWGDYNNDGDLDLVIAGYTGSNRISKIYRNDNGNFVDINAGLTGVDCCALSWGDYDNDGDLDLALTGQEITGYPNFLYTSRIYNNDDGDFEDINAGLTGVYQCALSWGDYDNDGDLDLAIAGAKVSSPYRISKIYRNDGCNNNWIDIQTRGNQSNADGIGARVKCGSSSQWREVSAGEGWVNRMAHFGIGNQTEIDEITVQWPKSGITDTLFQVQANQKIKVIEDGITIVTLIAPNGGEYIPSVPDQNHTYEIQWYVESPTRNYVSLHYSTDGGVSYPNLIIENTPNNGCYIWNVPDISSSNTRVRIQVKDNEGTILFEDTSFGDFTIDNTPPSGSVILLNPEQGSTVGSQPRFEWQSSLIDEYNLDIVIDNLPFITNIPADSTGANTYPDSMLTIGNHSWSMIVYDQAGNYYYPGNSNSFIVNNDIFLITPNGGEILPGASGQNHQYEIQWLSNSRSYITLHYSTDSGASFPYLIADNEIDDGTYIWAIPSVNSSNVRVRIQFNDDSGTVLAEDMSENDFSIDNIPPTGTITLVSPANGDWTSGTPYFDWYSGINGATNMAIVVDGEYLITGLTQYSYYQTPPELALSSGWHTWTVRGLDVAGNWVQASQTWSIRVDATPPSLFSLLSPEDNVWLAGASPLFQWTPSMDNGTGLAEYQLYMNNNLVVNYIPSTVTQWSAITGSLEDDFESGLSNWNTQGNWGLTTSTSHSGNYSVTDSPGGNYSNNQNVSITLSQPVSLQGASNLTLSYWYQSDFYYSYLHHDYLYVEISSNGSSWTEIAEYSDNNEHNSWTYAVHNLDNYSSWTEIYVRFRLVTGGSGTADGFYFDDFSLIGSGMELAVGDFDWYVDAIDNVGNIQQSQNTLSFHIDTSAPQGETGNFSCISPGNNFWTADSLLTFTWNSCIDAGIGLDYYELFIDGSSVSGEISDTIYTITSEQVLESGTHNWQVIVIDSLGNSASTSSFTLNIDRIPPATFSLISPIDNSFFIMPTPSFEWNSTTDNGSGISHYELWIDDVLNVDNLTQTQTAPGIALSEGYHTWYVVAEDNVENRIQSSETWTAIGDWNPPTQPIPLSPINNEIVSFSQPDMIWFKSTDEGTGVSYYDLYIDNELVFANYEPVDINADTVSVISPISLENGDHTWYVRAFDYAGGQNSSTYGFFEVDVDITPPSSEIIDPVFDQYIGGEGYLITGSAEDNIGGVGVEEVEISFDGGNTWFETSASGRYVNNRSSNQRIQSRNDSGTSFSGKNTITSRTSSASFSSEDLSLDRIAYDWEFYWEGYETGSFNIMTRATDFNGNIESPPNALQVNVEIIPPLISNINISPNPASDGTVNFTIYFQTGEHCGGMNNSITPVVTYTPYGGTSNPITQTNYQGNTWHGQTIIAPTDLNGTAGIYVSGTMDNINNAMLPDSSFTFVIDTQIPYSFDLIAPINNSWGNDELPLMSWGTANDSTTSIDHYSLEIDGSTNSPGINYISSSQTSIVPAEPLTLGIHNWRIKAIDQAGNFRWSTSTYTFGLDLSDPVSEITSPSDGGTVGGLSYTITGTATDGGGVGVSGVDLVEIRFYHNSSWTNWLSVINTGIDYDTWSYEWIGYESGNYTIESRATDIAGNLEIPQLQTTVNVDLNPPVVETAIVQPNPASVGEITCSVTFDVNDLGLNFSIHPEVWFTISGSDSTSFVEASYYENTWTGTANISTDTDNGTAMIHVSGAKDNINNIMLPDHSAGNFTIDTQAPTVSTINITPEITNVRTDLQVEVEFLETTSGLNSAVFPDITIIPLDSEPGEWIAVIQTGFNAETGVWSGIAEITEPTNEGNADIQVSSAEDLAGNVMVEAIFEDQVLIDHSPPEEFEITYPTESLWIANRQPEFTWTASSDTYSGLSCYQLFINDNQIGENISPEITNAILETPLPDAGYRVRIKALDNAQEPNIRWSGTDSLNFSVDGTCPNTDITFPSTGYIVQGCSLNVTGTANVGIEVYAGNGVETVL